MIYYDGLVELFFGGAGERVVVDLEVLGLFGKIN